MIRLLIVILSAVYCSTAIASTTITAQVVRNEAGSGSTFVSSGFPFPPGLVTEQIITAGEIKVIVDGSEVAANVSALRGRHSDGSVRSALIQFTVPNMAQDDTLTASVIIDNGARTAADPAYVRPTLTIVQNNNVILPTDPDYITTTLITFQRLLPTGEGTSIEENQYTTLADDRFDALLISENAGTARYEEVRGMVTMWARTGTLKYFKRAVSMAVYWMDASTPGSSASPPCRADAYVNPDGRTVSSASLCGIQPEWQFARVFSYATMYLLTGYRDFWSVVAYNAQIQQSTITDQTTANTNIIKIGPYDLPRYNYAGKYGGMLAAYMVDATIPIDGQYMEARTFNWSDQFSWTLNAIISAAWDFKWIPFDSGSGNVPAAGTTISQGGVSASLLGVYLTRHDPQTFAAAAMPTSGYIMVNNITGGSFSAGALTGIGASATGSEENDYRQGMTGTRSNSPRAPNYSGDTVIPNFQIVFVTNFLIDYYLNVDADSRIPAMVKTNLDILLQQIRPFESDEYFYNVSGGAWGDPVYGNPYTLENPVTPKNEAEATPWELPEYSRIIAFVLKTSGESTVNGATYTTWYSRCIDTANNSPIGVLIWQWKLFGQFYGFGADTPWIMAQSSLPTPTYRTPMNYTSIPGDTPDLQRDGESTACDSEHLNLCTSENCAGAGGNWCTNVCQDAACSTPGQLKKWGGKPILSVTTQGE